MQHSYGLYIRKSASEPWRLRNTPHHSKDFPCVLATAWVRIQRGMGHDAEALVLEFEGGFDAVPETVGDDAIRNCVRWTADPDYTEEESKKFKKLDEEIQEEERQRPTITLTPIECTILGMLLSSVNLGESRPRIMAILKYAQGKGARWHLLAEMAKVPKEFYAVETDLAT